LKKGKYILKNIEDTDKKSRVYKAIVVVGVGAALTKEEILTSLKNRAIHITSRKKVLKIF
jgi:ribose 5-phosphate isomerase